MKKVIIIICLCFFSVSSLKAQTLSKQDAKKVSKEINDNINKIEDVIARTDWSEMTNLLDKTLTIIEKNADSFTEIIKNIDTKKVTVIIDNAAKDIEQNIDLKAFEERVEKVGRKIEESMKKD